MRKPTKRKVQDQAKDQDRKYDALRLELRDAGWTEPECDRWSDPRTSCRYGTEAAAVVEAQWRRDKREFPSLTWSQVFNGGLGNWGTVHYAAMFAKKAGYKFLAWGGRVYRIIPSEPKRYGGTSLTADTLVQDACEIHQVLWETDIK